MPEPKFNEEKQVAPDRTLSHERMRKLRLKSRIAKATLGLAAGAMLTPLIDGMVSNKNNIGPNQAMAVTRAQAPVEEETAFFIQRADEAYTAYRSYLLSGDPGALQTYRDILNEQRGGRPLQENPDFRSHLLERLQSMWDDPVIKPMLQAYAGDRPLEPTVLINDFIDAVEEIRTAVVSQDAERMALIAERYTGLLPLVTANMPEQLARLAVDAILELILSGDKTYETLFVRLYDAAVSQESTISERFQEALTAEFNSRVATHATIGPIFNIYVAKMTAGGQAEIDLNNFIGTITDIYDTARSAATPEAATAAMQPFRDQFGNEFVDTLLGICARGTARRAIELMKEVLATGSRTANSEFEEIIGSTLMGQRIDLFTLGGEYLFSDELSRLFRDDILNSETFSSTVNYFDRNFLGIAIRDIYTELCKAQPDLQTLRERYGWFLVSLVAGNAQQFGWLIQQGSDIENTMIGRADNVSDPLAIQLREMELSGEGLATIYMALSQERVGRQGLGYRFSADGRTTMPLILDALGVIESNLDTLSWLSGNPQEIERELARRARGGDVVAQELLSKFPSGDASIRQLFPDGIGVLLAGLYAHARGASDRRQQLVEQYGAETVDFVAQNLEGLAWVVYPVEDMTGMMREQVASGTETPLRAMYEMAGYYEIQQGEGEAARTIGISPGYSVGALAQALHDCYAIIRAGTYDRAALVDRYGGRLVELVEQNLAQLSWLQSDVGEVETQLQERTEDVARELQGLLFAYNASNLMWAAIIAGEARTAERGGNRVQLADARDALGPQFTNAVEPPGAARRAREQEIEDSREQIRAKYEDVLETLEDLEEALSTELLAPAGPVLLERMRRWRADNERLYEAARESSDPAELAAIVERQEELVRSMLSASELRKCVQMAFAMVSVAETGGETGEFTGAEGTITAEVDAGMLRDLLGWYNSLSAEREEVMPIVGDIVGAVLQRSRPELYGFIESTGDMEYLDALKEVYAALTSTEAALRRADVVERYGERFVKLVQDNLQSLAFLEGITVNLETLSENMPQELDAQMRRAYYHQDEAMFEALVAVYSVLRRPLPADAPPEAMEAYEQLVQMLGSFYGTEFVNGIREHIEELGFLRSPLTTADSIPSSLHSTFMTLFEAGPGLSRARFMTSFTRVAYTLPSVYLTLTDALRFSNASQNPEMVVLHLQEAVSIYRREFGDNDYLFSLYMNLPLLSEAVLKLARQRHLEIPPEIAGGIQTPEDLIVLFQSPLGQELMLEGSRAFDELMVAYGEYRDENNIHPESGDYTDEAVEGLRNRMTIIDALYFSTIDDFMRDAPMAFRQRAANAMINGMLVIANRDPYLIGPFLTQVVPTFLVLSGGDEMTFEGLMTQFTTRFSQVYGSGRTGLAFTSTDIREHFLTIFQRIRDELPQAAYLFGHLNIQDELRAQGEPWTGEEYMSPFLYMPRYPWWDIRSGYGIQMLWAPQMPSMTVQPDPTFPTTPSTVREGIGTETFTPGAEELHGRMEGMLVPPEGQMPGSRMLEPYRIDALSESTVVQTLNSLFTDFVPTYSDYWIEPLAQLQAAGYYMSETRGDTTTQRGETAVIGSHRTLSGGLREEFTGKWDTTTAAEQTIPIPGGSMTVPETSYSSETYDARIDAAAIPYAMAGPLPLFLFGVGGGIERGQLQVHHESRNIEEVTGTETTPEGEVQAVTQEYTQEENTRGILETYSRIAQETGHYLYVVVAGTHVPELRAPAGEGEEQGRLLQAEEERLRTRVYIVAPDGSIVQAAYGLEGIYVPDPTTGEMVNVGSQFMNYLYFGVNANRDFGLGGAPWLASTRFRGRDMLTSDLAAAGFDGAAIGFTIPTGEEEDAYSFMGFYGFARSLVDMDTVSGRISAMTPYEGRQAAGMALTNLLDSGSARDVYAVFYRGTQTVTVNPENNAEITDYSWATGTGEVMWRRIGIDELAPSWEIRVAAGGPPLTLAARARLEYPLSPYRSFGLGATVGYSTVDLLSDYQMLSTQADNMYTEVQTTLANLYGWYDNEASNFGFLVSGTYLYSQLSGWTSQEGLPEAERPDPNYGSLLFTFWADRHGFLIGGERMPELANMWDVLNNAMTQVQQNPMYAGLALENAARTLQAQMGHDLWRFALAYGYDGERVRAYIIGSAETRTRERELPLEAGTGGATPEEIEATYEEHGEQVVGSLYGLVLFGRPTRGYMDVLMHAFDYAPIVISQIDDPLHPGVSRAFIERGVPSSYASIYAGVGVSELPLAETRFERTVHIEPGVDAMAALRDCYRAQASDNARETGEAYYDRERLVRLYGAEFVALVEDNAESLAWMVRPLAEIKAEVQERQDSLVVAGVLSRVRAAYPETVAPVLDLEATAAAALRDIYLELRKPQPDMERLNRQYGQYEGLVTFVRSHMYELDWMMLPPGAMRTEFSRRAQAGGSVESRLAAVPLPPQAGEAQLTGEEFRGLLGVDPVSVIAAATNAESTEGLGADTYDVTFGGHLLQDREGRHTTFYIRVQSPQAVATPSLGAPVATRRQLVIGDETDLGTWLSEGAEFGLDLVRVDLQQQEDGSYDFKFTGDVSQRWFSAWRLYGGVTLPLWEGGYDRYDPERNFTVGGLVNIFQSHTQEILAGVTFARREFGTERWQGATVTISDQLRLRETETFSEQLTVYAFFTYMEGKPTIYLATEEEAQELLDQGFERMTGGVGLTWARVDVTTGDRCALNFFFEGGIEDRRRFEVTIERDVTGQPTGGTRVEQREVVDDSPIFRAGLSFQYSNADTTIGPTSVSIGVLGGMGQWPTVPGDLTREEYLTQWATQLSTMPEDYWWIMFSVVFHGDIDRFFEWLAR